MRSVRVFRRLLGVERTVIESVELTVEDDEEVVLARVRPDRHARFRCSRCGRRCPRHGSGTEQRRWRTLDLGTVRTFLICDTHRVECVEHGVVVAAVPWARPAAKHTYAFEDTCAWLAAHTPFSVVSRLLQGGGGR